MIKRVSHKMYARAVSKMKSQLKFMHTFKLQKKFFQDEDTDAKANVALRKIADHLTADFPGMEGVKLNFKGYVDYLKSLDEQSAAAGSKGDASEIGGILKTFAQASKVDTESDEYKKFKGFFEQAYDTMYRLDEARTIQEDCDKALQEDLDVPDFLSKQTFETVEESSYKDLAAQLNK